MIVGVLNIEMLGLPIEKTRHSLFMKLHLHIPSLNMRGSIQPPSHACLKSISFLFIYILLACTIIGCTSQEKTAQVVEVSVTPKSTSTLLSQSPTPAISPTPEPTACVLNPEWEDEYTIQDGDTLGAIAIASGLTMRELQEANCLQDRDILIVGQKLLVPNAFSISLASSPVGAAGVIVFIRHTEDQRNLWSVKSDGTLLNQITEDEIVVGQPSRSPNFDKVAFRVLTSFDLPDDLDPFSSVIEELPSNIWITNVDGTGLHEVADQGPRNPIYRSDIVWSPDSSRIAFIEHSGFNGSLVVMHADGMERIIVTTGNFIPPNGSIPIKPAWSPNGSTLSFVAWNNDEIATLKTISPESRARDEATILTFNTSEYADGPYWIDSNTENNPPTILIANRNQIGEISWQNINLENSEISQIVEEPIRTSPDSEWIAKTESDSIAIIDPLGSVKTRLPLNSDSFSWGTEGIQIVISQAQNGLLLIDVENDIEQPITTGYDVLPVWNLPRWAIAAE